jgi:hypothetical protein
MRRWTIAAQGTVLALVGALGVSAGDELRSAGWREDFRSQPVGWELRTKAGVKVTEFSVEPPAEGHDGALRMTAINASGMLATHLKHVDLHRTPLLRWRWRALTLPAGGDGRIAGRDDQAIGIYVSSGGLIRQKSVAYRWETDTPVGTEGEASYAAGIVKAKWTVLRNVNDAGSFFVEERNLAHDFQRAFGFVPNDVSVGVTCNSQYTGTTAVAELDWIEVVAEPQVGTEEAGEP